MKTINHSILGSGLSALIKDFKTENSVIFTDITNQIKKSKRSMNFEILVEIQYLGWVCKL